MERATLTSTPRGFYYTLKHYAPRLARFDKRQPAEWAMIERAYYGGKLRQQQERALWVDTREHSYAFRMIGLHVRNIKGA